MRARRACWNDLAACSRSASSNQNRTQCCKYSVGRHSLCGESHATSRIWSVPANNGVPPPPQKPSITPALASSRTAAWVTEVPVPSRSVVVLAMGMFQYNDCLPSSVTAAVYENAAVFKVVEVCSFGVEDRLEV